MNDETQAPKLRKVVLQPKGLGRSLGTPPKSPNPRPVEESKAKKASGGENANKTAAQTSSDKKDTLNKPAKRELTQKEIKAAAQKSPIRNKANKGRRKLGEPHPDLPFELYYRGKARGRFNFTGPAATIDAFQLHCERNNLTKWEALELLMRRTGPDPELSNL